jgi:hypothetical protein
VAALELERAVIATAKSFLEDKPAVLAALQDSEIEVADVRQVFELAADWSRRLLSETEGLAALSELVEKVELIASGIRVNFQVPLPIGAGETAAKILRASHFAPIKLKRRGVGLRLILDGKDDLPRKADPALLKAVARARRWFEEIASGHVRSFAEVAKREGLQKGYVARLMRLAFLSPVIVDAVVEGRSRAVPNLQMLMTRPAALPLCWKGQERLFDGSDPHDTQSFKSIN